MRNGYKLNDVICNQTLKVNKMYIIDCRRKGQKKEGYDSMRGERQGGLVG
jgi:hypothetical protein